MVISYYVIRNKETGQYIKGTPSYHKWSVDPRLFPSIGQLRSFITAILTYNKARREQWSYQCVDISQWVVDEMTLTVTDTKELHQVVTGKKIMELLAA
jgi:hypothetical protein